MVDFHKYISYDSETGDLIWILSKSNRALAGSKIRSLSKDGYLRFKFDSVVYLAHRVAWYMHYGEWPKNVIDHKDKVRTNNRILNLRDVTQRVNCQNSDRFNEGASFNLAAQKWGSHIFKDGKKLWLGYSETEDDAKEKYRQAIEDM